MERKREHLAQVDRHIADCKAHIAHQREIIQYAVELHDPSAPSLQAWWKTTPPPGKGGLPFSGERVY